MHAGGPLSLWHHRTPVWEGPQLRTDPGMVRNCGPYFSRSRTSTAGRGSPGKIGAAMILDALWRTFRAQFNKLAGFFWEADPIAIMQAEYDGAVAQIREGRVGLEQYRSFVERVGRQVARHEAHVKRLDATIRTYLAEGDRETAARFALELQGARRELEESDTQLRLHGQAYENTLLKI